MEKKNQPKPKKVLKNVPKDIAPIDEQGWLYQPVLAAMMRYDYNATQILAVVAIIREMQTAIREVIFNKGRAEDQLSIFPNEDFIEKFGEEEIDPKNEIVLTIPLSKFGSDKRRYNTLKQALKQQQRSATPFLSVLPSFSAAAQCRSLQMKSSFATI